MSAQASIGEPFLLSSYSIPQKKLGKTGRKSTPASLHATFTAKGSSEGYVTVAAQADGIHVLDVSTLHPVISHTLGPTTSFVCPAVTCISSSRKNVCTTYAAIASSSSSTSSSTEVSPEEAGKTIWSWQEDLSSPLADRKQERKSTVVPYLIQGLYSCPSDLDDSVLVTGEHGELTVMDSALQIKASYTPSEKTLALLKTFVSSRKGCTFVPQQNPPSKGVIITSIYSKAKDSIRVHVQSLSEDDDFEELGSCELAVKPDQISSLSLNPSGCLTILSFDLSLQSYLLSVPLLSSQTTAITTRPLPSFSLSSLAQPPSHPSVLALTSSHILLASPTISQDEIVLLLWDMQYSVLLTSHTFAIPSSIKESGGVGVQLVHAGQGQAVCVLSPVDSKKQQSAASTVLVVPFSVPPTSTIASALGKALNGAKWIMKESDTTPTAPSYTDDKAKLLAQMRDATGQNRVQSANELFFAWAKPASEVASDDDTEPAPSRPDLDYTLVKDILNIILQIGKPANAPYSSAVIRYLLESKVVSTAMVDGGILAPLRVKNDWKSIELALENIIDLTEAEIITTLYVVVAHHQLRSAKRDENAMEVDSPSSTGLEGDVPSVSSFLAMVLNYPTSSTPLRMAIRAHFKQADHLTTLLEVLNSWMGQWNSLPMRMLPTTKELHKDENGAFVLNDINFREKKREGLPTLNKVTYFVQTVMDAGFVTLLSHTPAHKVLRQLHTRLESEIIRSEQLQILRGPLESFVHAQTKAVKEAAKKKEKGKAQPVGDWRQRKRHAHAQAGLTIGTYQLEELLL